MPFRAVQPESGLTRAGPKKRRRQNETDGDKRKAKEGSMKSGRIVAVITALFVVCAAGHGETKKEVGSAETLPSVDGGAL